MNEIDDLLNGLRDEKEQKALADQKFKDEQKAKKEAAELLRNRFANHYNKNLVKTLREIRTKFKADGMEVKFPPQLDVPKIPSDKLKAKIEFDISQFRPLEPLLEMILYLDPSTNEAAVTGILHSKNTNYSPETVYNEPGKALELSENDFASHIAKAVRAGIAKK